MDNKNKIQDIETSYYEKEIVKTNKNLINGGFIMKSEWKEATFLNKIVTLIAILASLSVVVLAVLYMFDIWNQAINICIPLMGITMICQAYIQWNTSRKGAFFSIGTAVFIFICAYVRKFL